jgi:hypothetical protein
MAGRYVCFGSWPCKNTLPREVGEKPGPVRSQATIAAISGLVPTMFMTRVRVVGQDRESHLGSYFWKRFGEEVGRSHAGLHRAERMLDRLATQAHGMRVCIKAPLHSFEQMLMLPSWNPPLRSCRALRFKRTILTGCGPVAP